MILLVGAASAFAQTTQINPDSIPFAPPVSYGTGSGPFVFCADLDDDQDLDMAVTNQYHDYISIFLNDGDGTFQTQVDYGASLAPVTLFCADLDGDLDLDIAVSHINQYIGESPYVSIFLNNGDGTYQAPTNYVAGDSNRFIFCDDLDGDSDLDLAVVVKHGYGGSNIAIFLNNGDGTFEDPVLYPATHDPSSVFCADLNGDTYPDLAVSRNLYFNNGDGTFQPGVQYVGGNSVYVADLDGDLDLDLAVANSNPGTVSILLNNGDGTFQGGVGYPAGAFPWYVTGGDLDGDSDLDLVVAHADPGISILVNNGDGTFQSVAHYKAGGNPILTPAADSEVDLGFDAVSINGDRANAPYHLEETVFCADLDGDLDLDIAATGQGGGLVSVFMNLTQLPGNSPPYPFPLLWPQNGGVLCDSAVYFDWAAAFDPNLSDQIRYDLYISTSGSFPPGLETTIDSNVAVTHRIDTLSVDCYYWKVKAKDSWGAERWSTQTRHFMVGCGDLNNNCHADIGDLVYLVNYLYKQGPEPVPMEAGDVNEDSILNIADVIYLISYLYRSGSPPCSPP